MSSITTESSVFISSTGTEIGKTVVSAAIVETLHEKNDVGPLSYYKPVASGCVKSEWGYRSPDEVFILENTTLEPDEVHASYRFDAPLSPDKAAEKESESITLEKILSDWDRYQSEYDEIVVEGIGGVAVPLTNSTDVSDLAGKLDLPVILVVSSGLGTISHTRTAVEYLQKRTEARSPQAILLTPDTGEDIQSLNRDHLNEFYSETPIQLLPKINQFNPLSANVTTCIQRIIPDHQ